MEKDWRQAERVRADWFRQQTERLHGPPPADGNAYVAHHNFPVEFGQQFQKVGIDPNNPAWASWANANAHQGFSAEFQKDWASFWANNRNLTPADRGTVIDFARGLGGKYNYVVPF